MSRRLLVATLGAALALTGLTAVPAHAATWPAPVVVAGPTPDPFTFRYDPQTVVTPDGTTVASWVETGSVDSVMVAERPAGGAWSTPVPVAPANVWGNQLAVGPDGTLAIVYQNVVASKVVVSAVVRPPGGAWGTPVPLSDTTLSASSANVAVGAGVVTAVWVEGTGAASKPMVSTRPLGAAGTFGSATPFVDAGVSGIDVAASAAGTLVSWVLSSDPADSYAASTVRASFRPVAGAWEAPVSLSETGRRTQVAEPAIGANGTMAVAWESRLPTTAGYYTSARTLAAIRPPGSAWGAQSLLSDPEIEGTRPHVGVGPDGAATVVWTSYDGATDKVATRVHRSGAWEPQVDLTQSIDSESEPRLAVSPDGTAVVEFSNLANGIGVAIRPPGRAWQPTDFIAPAAQAGYDRALAVGARTVAVVWTYGNGDILMAVVADNLLPLPQPTAETGRITGPKKIEKGEKARYAFSGAPAEVTFECRVDKTRKQQTGATGPKGKKPVPWRDCDSPVKVKTKKLRLGKHTLYVRAVLDGVPDPTPSKKKFKVT
ncbi:hypothetical protein [Nocardioides sp.]|uniref:hypothetical protein n=1 Tax=Nocardioides sp. TaxID=35761 RepID=UPI001A35A532|nr:hypothetical protein [Nocardioides sp.]MBJ7356417.1 hypothetical protein [Nocardioides sp.]